MGPRELFYADIFASRRTGCRSGLGMPGVRDRHSGCVSAYMVEHDLFDFLLLSLPDNDWHSHKHGPEGQLHSIAQADLQLARVFERRRRASTRFLEEHAVIVMADHSQAPVTDDDLRSRTSSPSSACSARLVRARRRAAARAEAARAADRRLPSQRAAMVYALHEAERDAMRASVVTRALALDGVDLVIWLERDAHERPARRSRQPRARRAALRARRGRRATRAAAGWSVEGELAVLGARVEDGLLLTPRLPRRARARLGGADVPDLGRGAAVGRARATSSSTGARQAHVGGGSHGSLHASDSLGALVICGVELARPRAGQWAIRDVAAARAARTSGSRRQPLDATCARLRSRGARRQGVPYLRTMRRAIAAARVPARAASRAAGRGRCSGPRRRRRRVTAQHAAPRREHARRSASPDTAYSRLARRCVRCLTSHASPIRSPGPGAASNVPPAGRAVGEPGARDRRTAAEDARRSRGIPAAPTAAPI